MNHAAVDAFLRAFEAPLNRPEETRAHLLLDIAEAFEAHRSFIVVTQRSDTWDSDDPLEGC